MLIRIRATLLPFAAGAVVLVATAACAPRPTGETDKGSANAAVPTKRDQVVKMTYTAQLQGSLEVDFSQTIPVRVLTLTSKDPNSKGLTLLSVGPNEPVELGGERWFRIAFDLMNFDDNGKYRIRAGSPRELLQQQPSLEPGKTSQQPDQSNVLVQFWTTKPAFGVQPQTFDNALEPCPLEVSKGGFKGSLRCSKITDINGSVLSILMKWG